MSLPRFAGIDEDDDDEADVDADSADDDVVSRTCKSGTKRAVCVVFTSSLQLNHDLISDAAEWG